MKFTLDKKKFIEAVSINSRAISSKQNMPVLSGIYMKADNNLLELQSTDYELGFIIKIEAKIIEEGEIILSGKYLLDVIKKLPGATVNFNYNPSDRIAVISSDKSNYRLLSIDGQEFPKIERLENNVSINIKDNELISMIKKTSFAAAMEEIRPIFTGCLFDINENLLTMVATNTHRLAINKMPINNSSNMCLIIPARALNELVFAIKEEEEPKDIIITYAKNQVSFEFQNIYMVTRLLEGEYPDYKRVIPTDSTTVVTVNKDFLASAVDRVSLISNSNDYRTVHFDIMSDKIHIFSNNPEVGKAEDEIFAEVEGNELSISFNVHYLMDMLKIVKGDNIKLYLGTELTPMKVEDTEDSGFSYVVTPVRSKG